MLTIKHCVEKVEQLLNQKKIDDLMLFLNSMGDIPDEVRIGLDLVLEDGNIFFEQYKRDYKKGEKLGLYHPSQYLFHMLTNEIAIVGDSVIKHSTHKKSLAENKFRLDLCLKFKSEDDLFKKNIQLRCSNLKELGNLFFEELSLIERLVLESSELTQELADKKDLLIKNTELFFSSQQVKDLITEDCIDLTSKYCLDLTNKLNIYDSLVAETKLNAQNFLEHLFANYEAITKEYGKITVNFEKNKDRFLKKLKVFSKFFPEQIKNDQTMFKKEELIPLLKTFYDYVNTKTIPIVIMPKCKYVSRNESRIYFENGVCKIQKPDFKKRTETRTTTRILKKPACSELTSKIALLDGVIYVSSDANLELSVEHLSKNEKIEQHWPFVPEIARVLGKYVFSHILKPQEINSKLNTERILGLYRETGEFKYTEQGLNTYATAVMNYWDNAPSHLRSSRFGGIHPKLYNEETWIELFAKDFAYWIVGKTCRTGSKRYEFFEPTDPYHNFLNKWFRTHFRKDNFKSKK